MTSNSAVNKDELLDPNSWLDLYGDYLYRRALLLVGNPDTAEDLVQDTLLSAYQSRAGFRMESSIQTWLATILRNRAIDFMRKAVRREIPTAFEEEPKDDQNPDFNSWGLWQSRLDRWGIWDRSGYDALEGQGLSSALMNCIDKLPSPQRNVLKLKVFEELPVDEICKELNIQSSNLGVLLFRARLALRTCLDDNWFKKD